MQVTYQASTYKPEDVTGVYARAQGKKGKYTFKVFETATCFTRGSFFRVKGMGYTLREYITTGEELPEELNELKRGY